MKKILFRLILSALLFALCLSAEAEQAKKVPRIVFIGPGSATSTSAAYYDSFRQRLRELGYIEGKNIFIEARYAEGKQDHLFDLATELVTTNAADPVGIGLVASLARPGGNVTGLTGLATELNTKRLEVLKGPSSMPYLRFALSSGS